MIPNRAATTPDERNRVPHRVSTTWWTLGLPAVVLGVCGTLALAWRSELPEPLAAHWGPQGVDGTSSFVGLVLPVIGATGLLSVGMWAVGFFLGRTAMTRRLANAMAAWFAVFLAGVLLGVLAAQRGVADAAHAGDIDRALTLGAALATASAVAIALLTPGDAPHSTAAPIPADAPTVPLANSEQITWVRAVGQRSAPGIALAVLTFSAVLGATTRQWPLAIVLALVLGPMLIAELRWTVTVDRNGLTARSELRWPTLHVPLDEVERAEVVTVRPLRDFGGFGLRIGLDGRTGAVLRKGPCPPGAPHRGTRRRRHGRRRRDRSSSSQHSCFARPVGEGRRAAHNQHLAPGAIFHTDRGSNGGFNRWSQHLDREGVDGASAGLDGYADGSGGDAVAGPAADSSGGRAGVLGQDRRGDDQRGCWRRGRRVASGRVAVVPGAWRYAVDPSGGVVGEVSVVR